MKSLIQRLWAWYLENKAYNDEQDLRMSLGYEPKPKRKSK
jgi:hypothetical protein